MISRYADFIKRRYVASDITANILATLIIVGYFMFLLGIAILPCIGIIYIITHW